MAKIPSLKTLFFFMPLFIMFMEVMKGFLMGVPGVGTFEIALLTLYCLFFLIFRRGTATLNVWIPIFLAYTFLTMLYTSNVETSLRNYVSLFVILLVLPISFIHIKTIADLQKLNRISVWILVVFVLNGIICSTLGIGINTYGGMFKMGLIVYDKSYIASIVIVLIPFYLLDKKLQKRRVWVLAVAFVAMVLLILSMRRTSVLIVFLGFFFYFFYTSQKKVMIQGALGAIIFLAVTFPLYKNILIDGIQNREHAFSSEYDVAEEARYLETFIVYRETFNNEVSWKKTLFGKETFNSAGNYNNGEWGMRYLHVDYNKLLHTTGIVGVVVFLLIYIKLISDFRRNSKHLDKKDPMIKELKGVFMTFWLLTVLLMMQGGLYSYWYKTFLHIYMGGVLGVFHHLQSQSLTKIPEEHFEELN